MTPSAIYRKAAQVVDSGHTYFSCIAVSDVCLHGGIYYYDVLLEYRRLFAPNPKQNITGNWGAAWSFDADERRACRTLALCFMSAIAEYEERRRTNEAPLRSAACRSR